MVCQTRRTVSQNCHLPRISVGAGSMQLNTRKTVAERCTKIYSLRHKPQRPTRRHPDSLTVWWVKPLSDTSWCFKRCLILRAHNTSRLVGIRSNVPPQICAPWPASKASEIVPVSLCLGLEEANPADRAVEKQLTRSVKCDLLGVIRSFQPRVTPRDIARPARTPWRKVWLHLRAPKALITCTVRRIQP